jgi:hypothetical protein
MLIVHFVLFELQNDTKPTHLSDFDPISLGFGDIGIPDSIDHPYFA